MSPRVSRIVAAGLAAAALTLAVPAAAQSTPPPVQGQWSPGPALAEDADAFGPNPQYTVISSSQWQVMDSATHTKRAAFGYMEIDKAAPTFRGYRTQLDLPAGANVSYVAIFVRDDDTSCDWYLSFHRYEAGSEPNPPHSEVLAATSYDTHGYGALVRFVDVTIRARDDVDGDGISHPVAYILSAGIGDTCDGDPAHPMMLFGALIGWKRTVSSPPADPTFADVDADHWAFPFVEALAASGITAGCGGGNYCPEDPITRAEMAVYLAAALGLHWLD